MEKLKRVLKRVCIFVFAIAIALPLVACGKSGNVESEAYAAITSDKYDEYIGSETTTTKMSSYTFQAKIYDDDELETNIKFSLLAYGDKVEGSGFIYVKDEYNLKFEYDSTHIEYWNNKGIIYPISKSSYTYDMVGLFNGKNVDMPSTNRPTGIIIANYISQFIHFNDCEDYFTQEKKQYNVKYYKSLENANKFKLDLTYTGTASSDYDEIKAIIEFDKFNRFAKAIVTSEIGNQITEASIVRYGYETA